MVVRFMLHHASLTSSIRQSRPIEKKKNIINHHHTYRLGCEVERERKNCRTHNTQDKNVRHRELGMDRQTTIHQGTTH